MSKPTIKTLRVCGKTADQCSIVAVTTEAESFGKCGYVPPFFPGGDNDFLDLHIDVETGRILNWKKPSQEALREWFVPATDE